VSRQFTAKELWTRVQNRVSPCDVKNGKSCDRGRLLWVPFNVTFVLLINHSSFFFPVALQPFRTVAASHIGGFLNYIRQMVGLLGRMISPSQGLYLHRTTQHRKMRTNIHALSGIRTHDHSNQPAKTHASDRTVTVTGSHSSLRILITDRELLFILRINWNIYSCFPDYALHNYIQFSCN
jgi:hypothetical protein